MLLILSLFFVLHSVFYEPFEGDVIGSRWVVSKNEKFNGVWALESRFVDSSNSTIKGLVTKSPSAYHAISLKQEIIANSSDSFVLQYENQIQVDKTSSWGCGGSYLKLLNQEFNQTDFNNNSPYVIMFGPDKCDSTNQVHFIYRTQNPLSKVWSEHKLKTKVPGLYDNITHLYTLVVRNNDSFEIKVDNKVKTTGSLHDNDLFDTPFEPPKLIADANEIKPSDWVDIEQIPDPNESKPADWNETEPEKIPDLKAVKPDDWKVEESLEIPDATAVKPADWNETEDGPYVPGVVDNPYCANHGCGPWNPPLIKNPLYKGKWKAKLIPNPAYKGKWKPHDVPNPYYYTPEKNLYKVGTIYGVGFELVSPKSQWFGNIFLDSSATAEAEAERLATEKWLPVNAAETVAIAKDKADADAAAAKAKAEEEAAAAKAKAEADLGKSDWRTGSEVSADAAPATPPATPPDTPATPAAPVAAPATPVAAPPTPVAAPATPAASPATPAPTPVSTPTPAAAPATPPVNSEL